MAPVGVSASEPSLLRAESEGREDGWIYGQPVLGGERGLEGLVGEVKTPGSDVTLSRATWVLQARPSGAPEISPHTAYEVGSYQKASPGSPAARQS